MKTKAEIIKELNAIVKKQTKKSDWEDILLGALLAIEWTLDMDETKPTLFVKMLEYQKKLEYQN